MVGSDNNRKTAEESLLTGTIIYFIGNVLTQLISIFILKLITGNLSSDQYGYFNLVVTVDNLVTPIITLQISDAVFRFFIQSKSDIEKKSIYSNGAVIILSGAVLTCFVIIIVKRIWQIQYAAWVAAYVVSTNLFSYNQRVVRSLGKNKEYVISNIIKAVLYLILQLLLVVKMKMGVAGLFISNCASTFACIIILMLKTKSYLFFDVNAINIPIAKEMVKFSAPLIPNTAIWWMQSSINAVFITKRLGLDYNGIYAISLKFATILNLVITVFNLSWQETAIREYGSDDYDRFATHTFSSYVVFMLSCVLMMIPLLKIALPFLIAEEYYEAIKYIPFLIVGTVLSACSGFFAQIITAKNLNIKLLSTNLYGAVVNIIIVFLLINRFRIWAVVISSVITNICLVTGRFFHVKDMISIKKMEWKEITLLTMACVLAIILYLYGTNEINTLFLILSLLICFFANRDFLHTLLEILKRKL